MPRGLPRDAQGMRRLKAMGFSDKRLAYLALKSANLRGNERGVARGSGLIHEAVKAMTGGVTEDGGARGAAQTGRAPGVQAHRHLRGGVRGQDAVHVFDL